MQDTSVLFTRTKTMRPLPAPAASGNLEQLWSHVNVPESDRPITLAWTLESLRPDTPFAILEMVGEQGSAKSTTQRKLRALIDPNKVSLRGRPKTVEDIFVSAANNWIVSFENLSSLTAEQQDALCTLATGGGYASRQFYTNGEEHVLETKRPVMLNGISGVAAKHLGVHIIDHDEVHAAEVGLAPVKHSVLAALGVGEVGGVHSAIKPLWFLAE